MSAAVAVASLKFDKKVFSFLKVQISLLHILSHKKYVKDQDLTFIVDSQSNPIVLLKDYCLVK